MSNPFERIRCAHHPWAVAPACASFRTVGLRQMSMRDPQRIGRQADDLLARGAATDPTRNIGGRLCVCTLRCASTRQRHTREAGHG